MIKTGLTITSESSADMIRLLLGHPDVELRWVACPAGAAAANLFDELTGEVAELPSTPDWDGIDLYIGPWSADTEARILRSGSTLKAVFTDPGARLDVYEEGAAALGVAEFNRKTLVRGARVAAQPDAVTMLCALALMPLAKNLLLGPAIGGTVLLPGTEGRRGFTMPGQPLPQGAFRELHDEILSKLQTSSDPDYRVYTVRGDGSSTFAAATLGLGVNMSLDDITALYRDFYDDHRHVALTARSVSEAMVRGTDKAVISLRQGQDRTLWVTVGFDAAYKAGAGNAVHLLNLLFGLDERTGLAHGI